MHKTDAAGKPSINLATVQRSTTKFCMDIYVDQQPVFFLHLVKVCQRDNLRFYPRVKKDAFFLRIFRFFLT